MAVETRTQIKAHFETGDEPTQAQFENFIDSAAWKYESIEYQLLSNLGSKIVGQPICLSFNQIIGAMNMVNQQGLWSHIIIHEAASIVGLRFYQALQGSYTSNGFNGMALFTQSGGTLTRVAISTDNGNLFKGSSNTVVSCPFSTPYDAIPGVYYACFLYCSSAQTTAPQLGIGANMTNSVLSSFDFTNSVKLNATYSSMGTSIPSSQAMSHASMAASNNRPWVGAYKV
jgi:hypothetical protein